MAITALEYLVVTSLRDHRQWPAAPSILEMGESNWYGDVPLDEVAADLARMDAEPKHVAALAEIRTANRPSQLYELARLFFNGIAGASAYASIDPGTPGSKYRFDLNRPVPIDQTFDVVCNFGTAEHIFNIAQLYETVHDRTRPGGLMVHSGPFTGWPDHGFFSLHPTLYFDLARENDYTIESMVCAQMNPFKFLQVASHEEMFGLIKAGKIPAHSHLNVVFRKTTDAPFRIPTQAYYAGALSPAAARGWRELR
jgi:SAM-dependent methyltransferase